MLRIRLRPNENIIRYSIGIQIVTIVIWNFAPVHLSAPPGVLVQRENMASSLALLSYHLKQAEEGLTDEKN